MPLHLLGKKSWNVYNPENVARVRKDEAEAKAQEAARERLEKESEGARRLQQLRPAGSPALLETESSTSHPSAPDRGPPRKRRRLAGENDTDRDLRHAREDLARGEDHSSFGSGIRPKSTEGLLHDTADTGTSDREQGMRLADAAGFKQNGQTPWYTSNNGGAVTSSEAVGRDVWGNEDPRRRVREQQRMLTNDPLLAIKKGVKQLRENEKQKKDWRAQRERDLNEVEQLAKESSYKRRRRRHSDGESLEGFSLDATSSAGKQGQSREQEHDRHKHRHSRSHHSSHHHHHRHKRRYRSKSPSKGSQRPKTVETREL